MKLKYVILLSAMLFLLSACDTIGGTKMQFSFSQIIAADFYGDQKTIYINDDMEILELNAVLKANSDEVTVQVIDSSDNEVVWADSYEGDADFRIELTDLKADSMYLLKVEATQVKKVKLTVTCEEKLVKDKEKPEKYSVSL